MPQLSWILNVGWDFSCIRMLPPLFLPHCHHFHNIVNYSFKFVICHAFCNASALTLPWDGMFSNKEIFYNFCGYEYDYQSLISNWEDTYNTFLLAFQECPGPSYYIKYALYIKCIILQKKRKEKKQIFISFSLSLKKSKDSLHSVH